MFVCQMRTPSLQLTNEKRYFRLRYGLVTHLTERKFVAMLIFSTLTTAFNIRCLILNNRFNRYSISSEIDSEKILILLHSFHILSTKFRNTIITSVNEKILALT